MTYWGSFGQQQPRRHIGGVTSSAAGQQNDDNLRQSAFGQQQQRQPASGGNWQSAMASGGRRTNTGRMQDLQGQITGSSQYGALQEESQRIGQEIQRMQQSGATREQLEAFSQQAKQRMAPLESQFNQATGGLQQQYTSLGQSGYGQPSGATALRTQMQQQSGGYPQPYGIRNAPSQRVYAEQRGYMPDPGSGYRPGQGGGDPYGTVSAGGDPNSTYTNPRSGLRLGQGGGYSGGQQAGPVYDPNNYRRLNPASGNMATIKPDERDRYARLYGYNVEGTPTYDRQRFEAEQLGRINGADTLQGRAQGLIETTQLGQLDIAQANQRLDQLVRTGQLSISQRNQALQELQNSQQYGLQGQRLGLDTELGRGNLGVSQGRLGLDTEVGRGDLDLRRLQNAQDWQYKMAQTSANPANAATMAALSGNAPWLRPQQPQIAAAPGSPLSSAQTGVLSGREMNYNTYGRLNPSEQAAYGSYARAAYGVEQPDLEQQMRQYAPGQGSGMQTARWR